MAEQSLSLTVTLETVTPLFLGGAEPRGAPELRPPAFRGAMRYWLRAALGGAIGDRNLEGLHKLEKVVFGSTDYGSPINIRLLPTGTDLKSSPKPILPHKPTSGSRPAFNSGQGFELRMWQSRSRDQTTWQAACAALRLALTFGGVGLRSRRGYGTMRIVKSSEPALLPPMPTSLNGWEEYARQTAEGSIAATRALAQSQKVSLVSLTQGPAKFPCATQSGIIQISGFTATSAEEVVKGFMQKTRPHPAMGGIKPRQSSPLWVRPIFVGDGFRLLFVVLVSSLKQETDYAYIRQFLDHNFAPQVIVQAKGWNA